MKHQGPTLESLLGRLSDPPADLLVEPREDERGDLSAPDAGQSRARLATRAAEERADAIRQQLARSCASECADKWTRE